MGEVLVKSLYESIIELLGQLCVDQLIEDLNVGLVDGSVLQLVLFLCFKLADVLVVELILSVLKLRRGNQFDDGIEHRLVVI